MRVKLFGEVSRNFSMQVWGRGTGVGAWQRVECKGKRKMVIEENYFIQFIFDVDLMIYHAWHNFESYST